MANMITLLRVVLAFCALFIVRINMYANAIAIGLIIVSLLLDAADGYIARYLNTSSLAGSVYDILADRIIENLFFIYFAEMSLFNAWFAIVIMVRGLTIDAMRTIYSAQGKTAFGQQTFHKQQWAKFLTCSRFSRGLYNTSKMITFVGFASLLVPQSVLAMWFDITIIQTIAYGCLWVTMTIAMLRALPVIIEGAFYIRD